MEIYIDLIILQDTFIMTLILSLVNIILNLKTKLSKIILWSFCTSILSILIMIYLPQFIKNFYVVTIVSLLTIATLFKFKSFKNYTIKYIYSLLVTFLLGGIGMTLDTPPLIMLIIFLLVVVYIAKSYLNKKTKFLIEQTSCNITFDYHNQKYILNALIDTGNIVKTIWNEDVIFINEKILNTNGGERRVYYKTVSGIAERNGVKLKNIKYKYGGIDKINDAVIVSSKNISNEFDAIVSFNFIKGGIENGNTIINKKACTKTNL